MINDQLVLNTDQLSPSRMNKQILTITYSYTCTVFRRIKAQGTKQKMNSYTCLIPMKFT